MKTVLIRLALSLLFAATASADWVIESNVESAKVNGAMTIKVKGDKMRMDIPNERIGAVSSVVDTKTGDTLQIVHAQKAAMKIDHYFTRDAAIIEDIKLVLWEQMQGIREDPNAPGVLAAAQLGDIRLAA